MTNKKLIEKDEVESITDFGSTRAVEHYRQFVEHSTAEHAARDEIVRRRIAALGGGESGRR